MKIFAPLVLFVALVAAFYGGEEVESVAVAKQSYERARALQPVKRNPEEGGKSK